MGRAVVRYTVKAGTQDYNAELVGAVYRELAQLRPAGFSYATYRLDDGRTFVHIAEQEGDGASPLPGLAAFRAFQEGIPDRCEWGPVVAGAELVGRYSATTTGAPAATPFTHIKLTDVRDSGPDFGLPEDIEVRLAKDDIDGEWTGISHHRLEPGSRQPFGHRHEQAEEIYVVIAGSGSMKLDDEIVEIEARDAIRVAPTVIRAFEAGPDGLELVVIGTRHDGDSELIPGWWTP